MARAKNKKQLQKLLGIINWYRPFISNLSSKISHLYEKLNNKNSNYILNDEEKRSLRLLYHEILQAEKLYLVDPKRKITIFTDASEVGIGCVLTQDKNIIGYYSHKLLPTQKRYTTMEKELLVIILCLKHFRKYYWV